MSQVRPYLTLELLQGFNLMRLVIGPLPRGPDLRSNSTSSGLQGLAIIRFASEQPRTVGVRLQQLSQL